MAATKPISSHAATTTPATDDLTDDEIRRIWPRRFPRKILKFPREKWNRRVFSWPVFDDDEDDLKLAYAARECSRRWATAIKDKDLGSLDVDDFALAMFDRVEEMNDFFRDFRCKYDVFYSNSDEWQQQIEHVIRHAHRKCYPSLAQTFPASPKLALFANVDNVAVFVRGAMGSLWQEEVDSLGSEPPKITTYDSSIVDKYIPDPSTVPPRPFTMANLDNPDAEPVIIWLNHNMEEVPQPTGINFRIRGRGTEGTSSKPEETPLASNDSVSSSDSSQRPP